MRTVLALVAASLVIAPQVAATPTHHEVFNVRMGIYRTLGPRTDCNLTIERVVVYRGHRRLGYMPYAERVGECGARFHGFGVAMVIQSRRHRLRVIVVSANFTPRRVLFDWRP